jgi:hypothetical protein
MLQIKGFKEIEEVKKERSIAWIESLRNRHRNILKRRF